MTTVKDLVDKFNVDLELEEYILDYELDGHTDGMNDYHIEDNNGKKIHVFGGEIDLGYPSRYEYIIEVKPKETVLTYAFYDKKDSDTITGGYQTTWTEDGLMMEERY